LYHFFHCARPFNVSGLSLHKDFYYISPFIAQELLLYKVIHYTSHLIHRPFITQTFHFTGLSLNDYICLLLAPWITHMSSVYYYGKFTNTYVHIHAYYIIKTHYNKNRMWTIAGGQSYRHGSLSASVDDSIIIYLYTHILIYIFICFISCIWSLFLLNIVFGVRLFDKTFIGNNKKNFKGWIAFLFHQPK
jgi:hypothetical protein